MIADDRAVPAAGLLLDTSVLVATFRRETAVTSRLRNLPADMLLIPAIVLGELAFGARASLRVVENLRRFEEFAAAANVVPCDADTARFYGEIRDRLKRIGRPIPDNDVWIAATARQHRLTLVTRDAHFEQVNGLSLELW